MAPPATKRRKLSHSGSSDEDDSIISGSDDLAGHGSEELDNSSGDEDVIEEHGHHGEEDTLGSEDEEVEPAEEDAPVAAKKRKLENGHKMRNGINDIPQDGVYTGEIYKSNLFKLQVDELLKQVKPNYGKMEAPMIHAMGTLRKIINSIPSREPELVCHSGHALSPRIDSNLCRYKTRKDYFSSPAKSRRLSHIHDHRKMRNTSCNTRNRHT
jgi:U3 small nucleolar RNA-associated protein 22